MCKSRQLSSLSVVAIASMVMMFGAAGCRNSAPNTATQAQPDGTQDAGAPNQPVQADQSQEPAAAAHRPAAAVEYGASHVYLVGP